VTAPDDEVIISRLEAFFLLPKKNSNSIMSQRPRHILTSSDEETEANPEVEVVAAETSGQKTPSKTPKKTPTPAPLSVKKKRAL